MSATLERGRARGYALDHLKRDEHHHAASYRELRTWLDGLELAKYSPRTTDSYERVVAVLLRAYPDVDFVDFTDEHVLFTLRQFPEKSRHWYLSVLNVWFRWGMMTRRLTANPCDLVPRIRYKPTRAYDVFTDAERDALCGLPSPDGALMVLLLWTGLRRAEARHLTVKRVDFATGHVIVIDGAKSGKDRKVPMVARVEQAVSELVLLEGLGRDDYLWYDRPGGRPRAVRRSKPIANSTFQRWYEEALAEAGVRYRKPHMTRHSFATKMFALGAREKQVQMWLGHSSSATTSNTYIHVSEGDSAAAMRALVGDVA